MNARRRDHHFRPALDRLETRVLLSVAPVAPAGVAAGHVEAASVKADEPGPVVAPAPVDRAAVAPKVAEVNTARPVDNLAAGPARSIDDDQEPPKPEADERKDDAPAEADDEPEADAEADDAPALSQTPAATTPAITPSKKADHDRRDAALDSLFEIDLDLLHA